MTDEKDVGNMMNNFLNQLHDTLDQEIESAKPDFENLSAEEKDIAVEQLKEFAMTVYVEGMAKAFGVISRNQGRAGATDFLRDVLRRVFDIIGHDVYEELLRKDDV